jgi:uncharacterized membrane protein
MIFHHAFLDVGDVLGLSWGYDVFDKLCTVQPIFWAIFIIISGFCTRLSRNSVKRGLIVFGCALVVTFVTVPIMHLIGFVGAEIYFGILHCLGICMIVTGLLMPIIKKIDYRVGAVVCILLFLLCYKIESGTLCFGLINLPDALYSSNILAPLGFHNNSFYSADYFPILPWIFMFLFGAFVGKIAVDEKLPDLMYKKHSKFLSFVGRNSLWVYLAHQPVLYAIMMIIGIFIK